MARHVLNVAALYAALDQQRGEDGLSWRQVAAETGLSPSTFTRLADGQRPDVDALCSLLVWLQASLRQFTRPAASVRGGAT
jgi:transcriptional regulator with XRE-family HTH domain